MEQSCGLDIALVLDSSGSIDSQTELPQMKSAFKDFVDAFLPNTPTEFSVSEFDTTNILPTLNFTNNISDIKDRIDAAQSGGSTNWEAGLSAAQGTFVSGRADIQNLVIFASDGNPNKYGNNQGSGNGFDPAALDAAITVANNIKNSNTRIITLGIGNTTGQDALNPDNLKAISSSDAYYGVADFASLAQTLEQLTTDLCGGTITIHKLIDQDRNLQTTDDQIGGADWQFTVADTPQTTDGDGYTQPLPILNGTYSVIEDLKPEYNLMAASCNGATINGTLSGNTISGIQVGTDNIVSCTFYNSPLPPVCTDADQDGYYAEGGQCGQTDCNDNNAAINPGATEICNGVDDNCNGSTDEGVQSIFYQDADGDTYGNALITIEACSAPSGYVSDSTDCNDNNSSHQSWRYRSM